MVLREFSLPQTGTAETRSVPEWSTKHFEAMDRPLRIAVDQANWWYRNITVEKDAEIRARSPGSHSREERIMERIMYLLRMNVQLLFVFDGIKRPAKLWPAEHRYSNSNIRFLKELLDHLGVPRHDAPGEAVAECVRLQELGVVDAIWTEDTDVLMFGEGPTIVSFPNKPGGDQFDNSDTVIVSSTSLMKERDNMTRKWFLMYGILVGCGYMDGLAGFSATKFFRFAQDDSFQAAANLPLATAETPLALGLWRSIVTTMIHRVFPNNDVAVPSETFPNPKILSCCTRPTVSPDEILHNLPCLRNGWFRPYGPDMLIRYRFLLSNFHKAMPESWIARNLVPIQLTHDLRETPRGAQAKNQHFGVEIWSKGRDSPGSTITIDPLKVLPELLTAFPTELYRIADGGARIKIHAPAFRQEEMELLDCVLRRGLGLGESDDHDASSHPAPTTKKPRRPPTPPPKRDSSRNFQPGSSISALQRHRPAPLVLSLSNTTSLPRPPPPPPPPLDTSDSPSCIHFHQGLTLPGDIDWFQPPVSSPLVASPHPMSAHSFGGEFPRVPTSAMTLPSPIAARPPAWDRLAGVDVAGEYKR